MKNNIDPAFKAAQQQNKLIAWAYPSKVKKTRNRADFDGEMAANNLRMRNAEVAAVQAKQAAVRAAEREAAKKKPLKEHYKAILEKKLEEAIRGDKTLRQTQHRMRKARGLNPKRQNRISSADHADFDTLDPLNRARLRNNPVRAGMSSAKGFETAMKAEFGIPKYQDTNTDWNAVNAYQRELHKSNGIRSLAPTPWSPQR
jgi:hypothetical protein